MADRPILIFPNQTTQERDRAGGGRGRVGRPAPADQARRLAGRWQDVANAFVDLTPRPDELDPERVIVLEATGPITDAARRAREIPGLEWLDEHDIEAIDPVGGFVDLDDPEAKIPVRLFALMSSQHALQELLRLWRLWLVEWEGKTPDGRPIKVEDGLGPFKQLFRHLTDVRLWGPRDRVLDTLVPWMEGLADRRGPIRFEAELWFRNDIERRNDSTREITTLVEEAGGSRISSCVIPEIRYHGVLLEAPAERLRSIVQDVITSDFGDIVRCEDVMFFRPGPQSGSDVVDADREPGARPVPRPIVAGLPSVALLDGLPLERHEALDGFLVIDDPDDLARHYRPSQQQHGTAMASLIVHGDLEGSEAVPLARPVYVRPVLMPMEVAPDKYQEQFPTDRLFVDIVHRAVLRMFVGEAGQPATAPSVRIVNLSLGNPWQRFDRTISPLAKLLDWLSWRFAVVFVVAAGNQAQALVLDGSEVTFASLQDDQAVTSTLRAMNADRIRRRLFSPAESINAITIGWLHEDGTGSPPLGRSMDPLRGRVCPSPLATIASGVGRAVKPDILVPGGRQLYASRSNEEARFELVPTESRSKPGQRVAAPGRAGELSQYWYDRGSSNATAIATRWSALILDRLLELRGEPGGDRLTDAVLHVLTKTLLVHGASWGSMAAAIDAVGSATSNWQERRTLTAKFLGYGKASLLRSTVATDERVLLLGSGHLARDEGHVFKLPLPAALGSTRIKRRLTATLAWVTPVNTIHRAYRRTALFLKIPEGGGFRGTEEVHEQLAGAGTVHHVMFEAESAVPIEEGASVELRVNRRETSDGWAEETVPYGLAVTLEVASPLPVSLYEEIQLLLRQRARVR